MTLHHDEKPMWKRILIATDLRPRSDRALDRALLLARETGARLVVLHVIDAVPRDRDYPRTLTLSALAETIRRRLAADLGSYADRASIRIERGDAAAAIERISREESCDLIVIGVERVGRLGRWTLGKTAERLVRRAPAPLLVVTEKPREAYGNVAVATDLSSDSIETTELASSWFPSQRIRLFHAYQPLAYGSDATADDFVEVAQSTTADWLAASRISPAVRERLDVATEIGDPARVLPEAAERGCFDLLVIGTRGHTRIFELLIGSVARRILLELPCDALFVRGADHLRQTTIDARRIDVGRDVADLE